MTTGEGTGGALVAIRYEDDGLYLLDQRVLPDVERWVRCGNATEVATAIRDMVVRGAPAIGIAAVYGLALAQKRGESVPQAAATLVSARPTAVNLRWAVDRAMNSGSLENEARAQHAADIAINRRLGVYGAPLLSGGVLTICNTGSLATGGYGTALGMVRAAREHGGEIHVFACETRPYRQGARLTAYECAVEGIRCTVVPDFAAAPLLASGRLSAVVVGCDRVARNGDTANKLGTLTLAILARRSGVPFYVAMPTSTFDGNCPDGGAIVIEDRPPTEFFAPGAAVFAHGSVDAWNPAFDVTPADLITAWVSENGVHTAISSFQISG